ncbi:MAG: hypothetical protein BJ554DRAFT_1258, partial [Olpidium bornovanus]
GRPYLLLEHPTTRQLAEKKLAEWDKRLRGRNSLLRRHWEGIEWARPIKAPPLGWELEDKAEAEASVQSGEMIDPRGLRARWPAWRDFDGRAVTDKAPEGPSPAPPPPQPPQPQQPQQQQQQQGPAHRTPGGAWRGGGSGPQAGRGKGRGRIPPLLPRGANDVVWGAPAPRWAVRSAQRSGTLAPTDRTPDFASFAGLALRTPPPETAFRRSFSFLPAAPSRRWAITYLAQLNPLIAPRRSDLRIPGVSE